MMRLALLMLMILPQLCCGLWRGQVVEIASGSTDSAVHGHHHDHDGDHDHHAPLMPAPVEERARPADGGHDSDEHPVPDPQHIDADDARASRSSWSAELGSMEAPLAQPAALLEQDRPGLCCGGVIRCADPGGGAPPTTLQAWRTVRLQV